MPNIKPVSDLRNYNEVLKDIAEGEPVFLTKNGRGKYAIIIIEDYEKMKAEFRLMSELAQGEQSGRENGWLTMEEVVDKLGKKNG
ncbi:MAG: prevent-host-death family protein [Fusobacteria bacterium]|nr:MAG: prevent-host-death family protein [Fusobacteriota bacterium]KAF0228822.1 MAG: prevent-host-death family [Fusobacteriota bacterium]